MTNHRDVLFGRLVKILFENCENLEAVIVKDR